MKKLDASMDLGSMHNFVKGDTCMCGKWEVLSAMYIRY